MRSGGLVGIAAGLVVAAVFVSRAVTGAIGVSAYERGQAMAENDRHVEAVALLDRGNVTGNRSSARWWAGQELLAEWDAQSELDRRGAQGSEALRGAARRFLAGRILSPNDADFTEGLGQVYARRETIARSGRTIDLSNLERGPWGAIGDDGRIAIGLLRAAIAHQPNAYGLRDRLVFLLEVLDLHEEALKAIEDCARVLPDFNQHQDFSVEELGRELVEAFWRASRSLPPGTAPLQFRERQLLSLGQLGRWLGHLDEAEHDLRAALDVTATKLFHAEDAFHLGLVLIDRGRFDEAEAQFLRAGQEPLFQGMVAEARGRIAEKRERWAEALEHYREARRLGPRDPRYLFEFSRAAEKAGAPDQAEEALRWWIVVTPDDPAPRRALVELFTARGQGNLARKALSDYVLALGRSAETDELDKLVGTTVDAAHR